MTTENEFTPTRNRNYFLKGMNQEDILLELMGCHFERCSFAKATAACEIDKQNIHHGGTEKKRRAWNE